MSTPNAKLYAPALAIALLPMTVKAQDTSKITPVDTTANTVVLKTLPQDIFEKQAIDSTTCDFTKLKRQVDCTQDENKNDSLSSKEDLKEKVKKGAKDFIKDPNTEATLGLTTKSSITHDITGFGVNGEFKNKNKILSGDISIGKNNQKSFIAYDLFGEYDFDMGKGFYVYPKAGLAGAKISYQDETITHNSKSVIPKLAAGTKYEKELNNGLKLGGTLEAGVGIVLQKPAGSTDYDKTIYCKEVSPEFLAKVFAEYKNLVVFVSGGKDAGLDYNIKTGVGFKFK